MDNNLKELRDLLFEMSNINFKSLSSKKYFSWVKKLENIYNKIAPVEDELLTSIEKIREYELIGIAASIGRIENIKNLNIPIKERTTEELRKTLLTYKNLTDIIYSLSDEEVVMRMLNNKGGFYKIEKYWCPF